MSELIELVEGGWFIQLVTSITPFVVFMYLYYRQLMSEREDKKNKQRIKELERQMAQRSTPTSMKSESGTSQMEEGPTDIAAPPRVRGEPSEWDAEPIEVRIQRSADRHRQERGMPNGQHHVELADEEIDRDAPTQP
jgi:hypothetical protein